MSCDEIQTQLIKHFIVNHWEIYHVDGSDWGEGSVFIWKPVKFANVLGNPKSSKRNLKMKYIRISLELPSISYGIFGSYLE